VVVPTAILVPRGVTVVEAPPTFAPTPEPTQSPTLSPTTAELPPVAASLSNLTALETFQDRSSPQYKALDWILEDPYVESQGLTSTDYKFIQRYVLATFYFSVNGQEWELCGQSDPTCFGTADEVGWLSNNDECNWYQLKCNANGELEVVNFCEYRQYCLRVYDDPTVYFSRNV
jgi:hypothetical protein